MKKVFLFLKHFILYSVGSISPFLMLGWFLRETVESIGLLCVIVYEPHLLDDMLNGFTPYFFAASSGLFFAIGLFGIFVSLFFIFRSIRYASFKYRAVRLAAAPTD